MPKEFMESSSNSELVLELIEVLQEEASLFETFLDLLGRQQRALVENDVNRLNEITEIQREKIVTVGILAKRREKLISELSAQNNMAENLTVSRLLESVSEGPGKALGQLRETILELNEKIVRVRSQNELLITRSRENIMKTMELLGRIKTANTNYHSEGRVTSTQTNLALDRRA